MAVWSCIPVTLLMTMSSQSLTYSVSAPATEERRGLNQRLGYVVHSKDWGSEPWYLLLIRICSVNGKQQAVSKKCVEHCGNLTLMREVSWRPIHAKIMVMAVSISWATQAASVEENSVSNQEAGSNPSFSTQPSCQS